jgi:hypothetical protein
MRSRIGLWVNKGFGCGLRENIKEMVHALSTHYEPDDQIYLFGFSRGAFTVRALAGFLYRCWLPSKNNDNFDQWFDRAFDYYTPFEVPDEVREFRACGVEVKIKFLGIWDTVKSYGGIIPIAWPHLRHNPIIEQVRHALALDEKRTYFQHTTWGSLKEKIEGISTEPDDRYKEQVVKEVWFRGYHSDIGGWYTKQKSAEERDAGEISLLWMLGEAERHGLRLNEQGKLLFKNNDDLKKEIKVHDSFDWYWWPLGIFPHQELNNARRPPKRPWSMKPRVTRDLLKPNWSGKLVQVHDSAVEYCGLKDIIPVRTHRPGQVVFDIDIDRCPNCGGSL